MVFGYWDYDNVCCIRDSRVLDQILTSFLEKKTPIDRVYRELATYLNSESLFFVIKDPSTASDNGEDSIQILDTTYSTTNQVWYCYTSIEKIKNDYYRQLATPISARSFFEKALNSDVSSIWINPSAVSCVGISTREHNNDIKRILSYSEEEQKKELKNLANLFSTGGKVNLVESNSKANKKRVPIRSIFEMGAEGVITIVDPVSGKWYSIDSSDREKIQSLADQ